MLGLCTRVCLLAEMWLSRLELILLQCPSVRNYLQAYMVCIECWFLQLHEIVEGLYFHCSLSVCLSVCLCVCRSVCPTHFLWTKFKSNGCTNLNAVFVKWLLTGLAKTLLKLVTLGQRSRSLWPKMYIKMVKKIAKNWNLYIFVIRSHHSIENVLPSFWYQIWPYCKKYKPKNYQWKIKKKCFWL